MIRQVTLQKLKTSEQGQLTTEDVEALSILDVLCSIERELKIMNFYNQVKTDLSVNDVDLD